MPLFRVLSPLALVVSISVGAFACSNPPPPEEPEPEPPPKAEPKEEPKPKPECKTLDEKCKADDSTQAKIANSELVFIPPAGWLFAQEEGLTLAQTEEGAGSMAIMAFDSRGLKPKELKDKRESATETLASALGIKLPQKGPKRVYPNWDKPDGDAKAGDLTLSMWELAGAGRGTKDGAVLVFLSKGDTVLIGLGFAPKDDTATQSILKALETIGPGSPQ